MLLTILIFIFWGGVFYAIALGIKHGRNLTFSETSEGTVDLGYRKRWSFMNHSEAMFFQILSQTLPRELHIFPKTRIADIIETLNGEGYYHRRNQILPKHVDFLICSSKLEPIMAIEVDGSSHNSPSRIERDRMVDEIFDFVKIPMRHVRVGTNFKEVCKELCSELNVAAQAGLTATSNHS